MIEQLRARGRRVEVLFLDCANEALVSRYRETRRVHPLAPAGTGGEGHRDRARGCWSRWRALADHVIDTSVLNIHQLKAAVVQYVSGAARPTVVNLVSFGFRYGTPAGAELLFDVRFLPNPYFEDRAASAHAAAIRRCRLRAREPARRGALRSGCASWLEFLLPLYDAEGKAYVTIGIGCTGGRHRSVAIAEALAGGLRAAAAR